MDNIEKRISLTDHLKHFRMQKTFQPYIYTARYLLHITVDKPNIHVFGLWEETRAGTGPACRRPTERPRLTERF